MTDRIEFNINAPFAHLVLSNPGKKNALTQRMWRQLPALLEEATSNPSVKGADISEFESVYANANAAQTASDCIATAVDAIETCKKPTLASIRGACVGGGISIALACDFCIADETAFFKITPSRLGLSYSLADCRRLYDRIGASRSKDLLFSARRIDAAQAKSWGLIDELFTSDQAKLETYVQQFAEQISAGSMFSVQTMKGFIGKIQNGQRTDDAQSRASFLEAFQNDDFQEGYRAFLEKRKPEFK